jgi:hypothetical protein
MNNNCIGRIVYADAGDSYVIYAGPKGDHLQVVSEHGQNPGSSVAPEYRVSRSLIGLPASMPYIIKSKVLRHDQQAVEKHHN